MATGFGPQPHWQQALDRKFEALSYLKKVDPLLDQMTGPAIDRVMAESRQVLVDMREDAQALRVAEVYSFSAETMHAIMTGAQSIPHESSLKSVEIPSSLAGWFWFAEPFPIASSPIASDYTHALLWAWDTKMSVPTLRFSTYVVDEKGDLIRRTIAQKSGLPMGRGRISPSTKWFWPIDATFQEMIGLNHQLYQRAYGPGSADSIGKEHAVGEKETLMVVAEMSLFFLMSCLWFRQTVSGKSKLTQEPAHIERHARKRYQREFKLNDAPSVRVIALRKSAVTEEPVPTGETGRKLKVRFVVSGHARLQPCGPGRLDRKLIWLDPYLKGPEDAPLKESGPKVFAVIR